MNLFKRAALALSTVALILGGSAVPASADIIWNSAPVKGPILSCSTFYQDATTRMDRCSDGKVRIYRWSHAGMSWVLVATWTTPPGTY
jgi:hypothetical protein